jgi:hypothetical protein
MFFGETVGLKSDFQRSARAIPRADRATFENSPTPQLFIPMGLLGPLKVDFRQSRYEFTADTNRN